MFIDEAYELGKGSFGNEAVGQLLNNLTLPEFMDGNTVVILAGYEKDMHKMLEKNAGLKSRFTSYVKFEDMSPEKCASIVSSVLKGQIPRSIEFERSDEAIESLTRGFADLHHLDRMDWANGPNAHEMAKKIMRQRAL